MSSYEGNARRLGIFMLAGLLLLFALALCSCESFEDEQNPFIGTWYSQTPPEIEGEERWSLTFHSDGTMVNCEWLSFDNGIWFEYQYTHDSLFLEYRDILRPDGMPVPRWGINYSIDGNDMIIHEYIFIKR